MQASELWGYIVAGIGLLVGLAGWLRNGKGDVATQAAWMAKVDTKLDHIAGELLRLNDIHERVAVLTRDVKTAFVRIDQNKEALDALTKKVFSSSAFKSTSKED